MSSYNPPKTFGGLIALFGAEKKKAGDSEAKYFFLRKSTTSFRLPPRGIIDAFWERHKEEATANIKENYERILKGERI